MHHDGIDRILDLVAHARGEPADGRHAPRKLQLRLNLRGRFQIVQRDQRSQPLVRLVVVDKVHRSLDAPAVFGANLLLHHVAAASIASRRARPSTSSRRKFARVQAQNVLALDLQEAPRRL